MKLPPRNGSLNYNQVFARNLNILADIAIEKSKGIFYTEFSSPSEPECLRQKWIYGKFAKFPRGQFNT